MQKYFILVGVPCIIFLVLTSTSHAETVESGITTLSSIVDTFTKTLVKSMGTLFMSMAVVAFFYGVVQYVWGARKGDATAIAAGNQFMLWSVIALFVMFSIYGIIKFGQEIFFQGKDIKTLSIPEVKVKVKGSSPIKDSAGDKPVDPGTKVEEIRCPDGTNWYTALSGIESCPKTKTCPDGVTKYTDDSDRKFFCNDGGRGRD